ncbi:MAG: hypothetical protein WBD41_23045 [Rhodococcus sp. (in: high G+C Gram-positive bacteria)]|uniref:hypothetical protein n=1 Tax=Rhodococcus sp. EPR-157 TaxID=1813677 RepID=UPI000A813C62|nr:hypothetical protein [Rhodococcus sp. EPR-157]
MALDRSERRAILAADIERALASYPDVAIRWFDAEAISSAPSDILKATTTNFTSEIAP